MKDRLIIRLRPILVLLAIIWLLECINLLLGHRLTQFGILPRTLTGLLGIPLSPFLHANLIHALLNTLPLLMLGALLTFGGIGRFMGVSVVIALVGGMGVWLFGRGDVVHVGASGLIFGYFGYLVARGWYARSLPSMAIALITVFFYGGIIWGILPMRSYVSWEGHLFGLLAGVLVARFQGRERV